MADLHQDGAGAGADFDLSQFYQIFFEEAAENLDQMEQMLLALDLEKADDEAIRRLNDAAFGGPIVGKIVAELRKGRLAVL